VAAFLAGALGSSPSGQRLASRAVDASGTLGLGRVIHGGLVARRVQTSALFVARAAARRATASHRGHRGAAARRHGVRPAPASATQVAAVTASSLASSVSAASSTAATSSSSAASSGSGSGSGGGSSGGGSSGGGSSDGGSSGSSGGSSGAAGPVGPGAPFGPGHLG
jgi:hypothetical protein